MFYIVRFNAALAQLGIDPTKLPQELRNLGQDEGYSAGCTPQEAALIVLSKLSLDYHMIANPAVARQWLQSKKIRPENLEIRNALDDIGWYELLDGIDF